MAAPGGKRCGHCKEQNVPLKRLNSSKLLEMMQSYDPRYTRRTVFCYVCIEKMLAKYKKRKNSKILRERQAQSRIDDQTTSYSDASLNSVLSQSSSPRRIQTGAGVGRNTAKRTDGAPTNRSIAKSHQADDHSDSPMRIYLPPEESSSNPSSQEQQRSSISSTIRRSNRSNTSNIDNGNDDYVHDHGNSHDNI